MFHERVKESPRTHLKCSCMQSAYLESPVQSCPMLNEFPSNPEKPADCEMNYAFSKSYAPWSLFAGLVIHTFLIKKSTYYF